MPLHKSSVFVLGGLVLALVIAEVTVRFSDGVMPAPSAWPSIETQLKSAQLATLGTDPAILFLGSSVTEAAVDPDLLTDLTGLAPVYNSALPFSSPTSNEVWLSDVVGQKAPGFLIVGIPIWPQQEYPPITDGIREAARQQTWEPLAWSALVGYRGVLANWDVLTVGERLASSGLWTDLGHQTGLYDKAGGSIAGRFPPFGEPQMTNDQVQAMLGIIEWGRAMGSTVIMLVEPGRFPGKASDLDTDTYLEWLRAKAKEWGVPLWDTYSVEWASELFADEAHFNRAGTVAYTTYLAGLLAGA